MTESHYEICSYCDGYGYDEEDECPNCLSRCVVPTLQALDLIDSLRTENKRLVLVEEKLRSEIAKLEMQLIDDEEILHDRVHKEVGRARAAKVHRVPSADEMVTAQQMTAPTNLKWEIDGHYFVPTWEHKDTSKWYNCAHCDAGYPDQECTCKENEE